MNINYVSCFFFKKKEVNYVLKNYDETCIETSPKINFSEILDFLMANAIISLYLFVFYLLQFEKLPKMFSFTTIF